MENLVSAAIIFFMIALLILLFLWMRRTLNANDTVESSSEPEIYIDDSEVRERIKKAYRNQTRKKGK